MVEILIGQEFIDYANNIFNNDGLISFTDGQAIELPAETKYIIPGYVERHIHGGYGIDFMDGSLASNKLLLARLPESGVTRVFPTSMSMKYENIEKMITKLPCDATNGARCDRVHLEGPFINVEKCGAQNTNYLKMPDVDFIRAISEHLAVVSYAPELDLDFKFIDYLCDNGIIPSVVHSNASSYQIDDAYCHGLANFSHFYNGASAFSHRNPGVINAGLSLDNVFLELICDGVHIDPYVVAQTYKLKGIDSIVLITDSMRAKGMGDGTFDLGGQIVTLHDGAVRLENGSLAGSVLSMEQAVKNFYKFTDCKISEAVLAATTNVARSLNRDDFGRIEQDSVFDITLLDEKLNVIRTYVGGEIVYDANNKTTD